MFVVTIEDNQIARVAQPIMNPLNILIDPPPLMPCAPQGVVSISYKCAPVIRTLTEATTIQPRAAK